MKNFATLINRLKQNDQLAFKELVYAFTPRLMTVARLYSKDNEEAKDILQDAFILVFRKIDMFQGTEEAAFYGWVKRMIVNLCLSRNQRKFRKMEKSIEEVTVTKGQDANVLSNMSHDEIMKLVFALPDVYRQVFALYAIEGYSHKEIGEKLDIQESSVRSRYHRARAMLRENFTKYFKPMIA